MYGFPADLDLSAAVGQEITQFGVGPYDLQFALGEVVFTVQSAVELRRGDTMIAAWEGGGWPSPDLYEVFCQPVTAIRVVDASRLAIALENGLELHILDASEQYESLAIRVPGVEGPYII